MQSGRLDDRLVAKPANRAISSVSRSCGYRACCGIGIVVAVVIVVARRPLAPVTTTSPHRPCWLSTRVVAANGESPASITRPWAGCGTMARVCVTIPTIRITAHYSRTLPLSTRMAAGTTTSATIAMNRTRRWSPDRQPPRTQTP